MKRPLERRMPTQPAGQLDSVMQEARLFPPPKEFAERARIGSLEAYQALWQKAADNLEAFWGELAGELHWFKPYQRVLEWNEPFAQWFVGGQTNVAYNCLDLHLTTPRINKAALIWEGEPGDTRIYTYQTLHYEVCKFANVLHSLGIKPGDVVSIYMPMVPELVVAMLACARVGAVHSVIFGGFSSEAIADRNNDARAKLLITADGGWRRGGQLSLKKNADAALEKSPTVKHCVVLRRVGNEVSMREGRDFWWHDLMQGVSGHATA
jgi:acetyl-CoA synthetase